MDIEQLKTDILGKIEQASDFDSLEEVRIATLSKKGVLTEALKGMADLSIEEKKTYGQSLNQLKSLTAQKIEEKKHLLENQKLQEKLKNESLDMTLPVTFDERVGRIHPVYQVMEEILAIFGRMGFNLAEGPDVEDDFHCFQALNIPPSHPARQMQATFFMEGADEVVLRTHTSPVQVRTMQKQQPPIKIVVPGRVYRCDYDMTHTPMFHQVEGLMIDKTTNMGHLKGCLVEFLKEFFGLDELPFRFRPSYFPFTEPSAEMDIGCSRENGEFKIEAGKDFLEILGCGMVHPNVLKASGIDPDEYQGFAFGMGLDRLAMLKYGIPDLRPFFKADTDWMKTYGFVPLDIPGMF